MIVCLCRGVTDRVIRAAIRAGATTAEHVAEMCGAGSHCGGCRPTVAELLAEQGCAKRRVSLPVLADFTDATTLR